MDPDEDARSIKLSNEVDPRLDNFDKRRTRLPSNFCKESKAVAWSLSRYDSRTVCPHPYTIDA
jgi:predicted transcriptional regulator